MRKIGINLVGKESIIYDEVDFDRYNFEDVSQLTSKDVSVVVNFKESAIEGDIVAHGDWYDLEYDECVKYLTLLDEKDIIRKFKYILR